MQAFFMPGTDSKNESETCETDRQNRAWAANGAEKEKPGNAGLFHAGWRLEPVQSLAADLRTQTGQEPPLASLTPFLRANSGPQKRLHRTV